MSECTSNYFDSSQSSSSALSELDSSQEKSQNSLSLSQLTLEDGSHETDEKLCVEVRNFYNMTPREIPVSPHFIFEEEFSSNPWAILVATIFLSKTSGKLARPVMKRFFLEYPTPYDVLTSSPNELEKFFDSLGLKKRANQIWRMTYQFVSAKWRRVSDLCGIGKYGEDAYRIFCLAHTDVNPSDRYLKLYLDWLVRHTDVLEERSLIDCENLLEDPVAEYYALKL